MYDIYEALLERAFHEKIITMLIMIIVCIMGITFTIFSVIHSFMENRKSLVKSYEQQMRISSQNPFTRSEIVFGKKYIKRMRRINIGLFVSIVASIVLLVVNIIDSLCEMPIWYYILVLCLDILYLLGITGLLIWYMTLYFQTTKCVKVK